MHFPCDMKKGRGGQEDKKIFCVLIGHDYVNEVQVIAQIFFAHEKFSFANELRQAPKEGYTVVASISPPSNNITEEEMAGQYCCTGELYLNGEKLASNIRYTVPDEPAEPVKRTLMLALFYALKEATGQPTPWGALTGVRPAKQVRIWLEAGDNEEAITERLSQIYKCRDDKIKLALTVARAEEILIAKMQPPQGFNNLCLYIGIPFCPSRCLYCSFITSQNLNGPNNHRRYLAALARECEKIREARDYANGYGQSVINAVYIGGGTPTALSVEDLASLLELVVPFIEGADSHTNASRTKVEYTVEAGRPDSITLEKLKLLKDYGVNRITVNPQTLNDETLKRIGRMHTSADFYRAYEMARQVGFANINTDVIAGLPGEKLEDMQNTMEGLKKLAPDHITVHTLAVKRASRLNEYRQSEKLQSGHRTSEYQSFGGYSPGTYETVGAMLSAAGDICETLGLRPYYMYRQKNMTGRFENVGYSRPGCECIYNVAMMAEAQGIIALGAGAVTKVMEGTLIKRKFNPKDVEIYIKRTLL